MFLGCSHVFIYYSVDHSYGLIYFYNIMINSVERTVVPRVLLDVKDRLRTFSRILIRVMAKAPPYQVVSGCKLMETKEKERQTDSESQGVRKKIKSERITK